MKVYAVQDATKGVAAVCTTESDAIEAAKQIKSNNTRQHYRVYEFPVVKHVGVFYVNRLVFDTRNIKD